MRLADPTRLLQSVNADPEFRLAARYWQAELFPGIRELGGFALSHLDVDASSGDGFVLFAN